VNLWGLSRLMNVCVLGMWWFKLASMLLMTTKFLKVYYKWEGCKIYFTKDNYMDNKYGKKKHEWGKICIKCKMPLWKFKLYQNQIGIQSHHVLKDRGIQAGMITCYGRKKIVTLPKKVLKTQVLDIVEVITSCLNPMVVACVMNQSHGHWLLFNALTTTMILVIKFQVEMVEMV